MLDYLHARLERERCQLQAGIPRSSYTMDSHSFHSDNEVRPRINRRAKEGGHSVWHTLQVSDSCGRPQSTGTLLPKCRKKSQYERGLNKCVLQNKLRGSMISVWGAERRDDPLLCSRRKLVYRLSICDDSKSKSRQSALCSVDADFDTLITAVCRSQEEFPTY